MLNVQKLTKSFGATKAVSDVSFSLSTGDVVGFLGPNGAGKTTTMRMLTGFLAPDRGSVTVDGIDMANNSAAAQSHIGYLPENNPLYRDQLVEDVLHYAAELQNVSKSRLKESIDFVVKATGIASVYYRPVGELSKGFRQRVGLACALIHRPKLLILDEPTEGLDPNQREEIRSLIRDLRKEHTVIISTHILQEATAVATRLLIINKGNLVADGKTDTIMHQSKGSRVIEVTLEGADIESKLKSLPGVTSTATRNDAQGHTVATLNIADTEPIQPKLSALVRENNWTVWQLTEKGHTLEDVFRELTT